MSNDLTVEVEHLRAKIEELYQRLADAEQAGVLAAARALGEGDRLRAELARAVADSDRLRDQLSQRPEGGYRLEWSGDCLLLVVNLWRIAITVAEIGRYRDTDHARLRLFGWVPRIFGYYKPTVPDEDIAKWRMYEYGAQDIECASPLEAMRVCRAMLGTREVVVPLHPDEMATEAGGAT